MNVDAQALGCAVLNDDAGAVSRSVSRSVGTGLRRWSGQEVGRWVGTDLICHSGQAVERDEASSRTIAAGVRGRRELSPPLNRVARRLRIRTQIIFFQRKVGVGLGKGARACG